MKEYIWGFEWNWICADLSDGSLIILDTYDGTISNAVTSDLCLKWSGRDYHVDGGLRWVAAGGS